MSSLVKQEFFRWISSLNSADLSDIELKLLNLLIDHFDTLVPLSTAKGTRAKKINELIQTRHDALSTKFPDVQNHQTGNLEKFDRITELKIGPFRGFATSESFIFDKKYTFMYGPNGSGKSSFCEGLEYALLGGIEEAEAKRIAIDEYVKNTLKDSATLPVAHGVNSAGQTVTIHQNQALYRFAFIEKNRIDGFARITATTTSAQKDRIATLFGLDAFSTFVDGFTDDFERYINLVNTKADAFKAETLSHEDNKKRILEIDSELLKNAEGKKVLLEDVARKDILSADDLKLFLNGADEVSGHIGELQRKKAELIPDDLKTESLDALQIALPKINASLKLLSTDLKQLNTLSSDVNFQDLYLAIQSIASTSDSDLSRCPACKTPIEQVVFNPFESAKEELDKLKNLSELQLGISDTANLLSEDVRNTISIIKTINDLSKNAGCESIIFPSFTEFVFTNIATVEAWKPRLELELLIMGDVTPLIEAIRISITGHNEALSVKREHQKAVDSELKKYQGFNIRLIELIANEKKLIEEKDRLQKAVESFITANEAKLKEIQDEEQKIAINQKYAEAYKKLIQDLKLTRNRLPLKLAVGLSEKVKEYYNIVNAHDPDFELLDSLTLPATAGEKIEVQLKGDSRTYDALHILSEGHIKVLGLSILLAKAVHENLGFLIFDDIVNAIDDDHRSGIADLLLCHDDLKNRQLILTCHGETFINKLEHKLGASLAGKHVRSFRFTPADIVNIRGIQVSIGDSKHYLLKAKESLAKNELKDSATNCRKAIESISYQLWKKLDKQLKVYLKVTMRTPGMPPDLATVVDSLIKELEKIPGVDDLQENFCELKSKYPWSLLNKGVHEDENQPEFERKDISELITRIHNIEEGVSNLRLSVASEKVINRNIEVTAG